MHDDGQRYKRCHAGNEKDKNHKTPEGFRDEVVSLFVMVDARHQEPHGKRDTWHNLQTNGGTAAGEMQMLCDQNWLKVA